ncbi:general negative regulator of transcription subunit 5 [Rhizina undulata]
MSARKLQQEVDRTFKRVAEGIAQFESIYDKLQQCTNASQKEKLEDSLKREIKKLQRHREQIKSWAGNSEIKDKKPLLDERKKIETQMEKFKAVEKEMKTKAYSKEGLLASTRLDPKAQQKQDLVNFLSDQNSELDRQIEACEAEAESLAVTLKKGKKDSSKADRVAEVERQVERHKWHQAKLELIMRLLENGQLEVEQVDRVKEDIKYYVDSNQDVDFQEDENIYDELNLDEENAEDLYGIGIDAERMSSQDTMSIQDDLSEKPGSTKDGGSTVGGRRPSTQAKSPMPAMATLHPPASAAATPFGNNGMPPSNGSSMKPASIPARPASKVLEYASVATAAAAADRNVGIAPLPPPPGMGNQAVSASPSAGMAPLPPPNAPKQPPPKVGASPSLSHAATNIVPERGPSVPPTPSNEPSTVATPSPRPTNVVAVPPVPPSQPQESLTIKVLDQAPSSVSGSDRGVCISEPESPSSAPQQISESSSESPSNGTNGVSLMDLTPAPTEPERCVEESVYHLPPCLQDLITTFETTKKRILPVASAHNHALELSYLNLPETVDAEKPRHYHPVTKYNTPAHYPQQPLPIFDDPQLYRRVDTDTLFYVFYYKQGTYQQYLAAKELKRQSWRFHKQYQTWFQRHEEPKTITDEFEQGTYRFFDYESTWMNRRKSDFKFAYKYLEDDL